MTDQDERHGGPGGDGPEPTATPPGAPGDGGPADGSATTADAASAPDAAGAEHAQDAAGAEDVQHHEAAEDVQDAEDASGAEAAAAHDRAGQADTPGAADSGDPAGGTDGGSGDDAAGGSGDDAAAGTDGGAGAEGPRGGAGGHEPLTRSAELKVIGGVCGGLGRYFGLDPVIFRVVLVVLALTGGVGLISYGIGWLLIPLEGEDETEGRRMLSGRIEGPAMTAALCALVGSGLFLSTIDNGNAQAFSLCLIAAVAGAVYWSRRGPGRLGSVAADTAWPAADRSAGGPGTAVPQPPPAAQPPPTGQPSWWRSGGPVSFEKTPPGRPDHYLWGPADGAPDGGADQDGGESGVDGGGGDGSGAGRGGRTGERPFGAGGPAAGAARDRRRDPDGGVLPPLVLLLALGAGTAAAALVWHRDPFGTALEIGLTAALAVFGLGMVAGAFAGRRGRGMRGWAVLATLLLAVAVTIPKSVPTDWHRTTWRPAAVSAVQPVYRLGAGRGTLDLTGLDPHGRTVRTGVEMGAGLIDVRVAPDVTLHVHVQITLGYLRLPGAGSHGHPVWLPRKQDADYPPPHGVASAGTVDVTVRIASGAVVVEHGTT